MGEKKWREDLDLLIEENLNSLIKETKDYDYAINKAKDKSKAQMWIAMALLNKKLNQVLITNKEYKKKLSDEEVKKILNTLEKL